MGVPLLGASGRVLRRSCRPSVVLSVVQHLGRGPKATAPLVLSDGAAYVRLCPAGLLQPAWPRLGLPYSNAKAFLLLRCTLSVALDAPQRKRGSGPPVLTQCDTPKNLKKPKKARPRTPASGW